MKAFLRTLRSIVIVLLVLGAAGALTWLAISWFVALPPTTQTPIAALVGVVLAPLIAFITSRVLERRRILETNLREKKTQLYDEMIKGLLSILNVGNSARKAGRSSQPDIVKFVANMTPRLITYASPRVIREWNKVRLGAVRGLSGFQLLFHFEDLLKAMRADLGHSSWLQPKGELLGLWINDMHKVDVKTMAYKPEFQSAAEEDE